MKVKDELKVKESYIETLEEERREMDRVKREAEK